MHFCPSDCLPHPIVKEWTSSCMGLSYLLVLNHNSSTLEGNMGCLWATSFNFSCDSYMPFLSSGSWKVNVRLYWIPHRSFDSIQLLTFTNTTHTHPHTPISLELVTWKNKKILMLSFGLPLVIFLNSTRYCEIETLELCQASINFLHKKDTNLSWELSSFSHLCIFFLLISENFKHYSIMFRRKFGRGCDVI